MTPAGWTDITDVTAKGVELDVVCNPTRNLRVLLNVAKQETVMNNSFPVTKELIARMLPVWNGNVTFGGVTVPMRDFPRNGYPVGNGPTNPKAAALVPDDLKRFNPTDPANAPRSLRYSDFVEAVEANEISRVLIAPDRGTAQVVENDGQRAVAVDGHVTYDLLDTLALSAGIGVA